MRIHQAALALSASLLMTMELSTARAALITSEDDSAATITYTRTAGFWDSFVCWASGEGRYVEPVYRHVPDNAYGGHYVMASPGGCAIF